MSHKKSSDLRRLHNRVGVQESESGLVNPAFQDDESPREAESSNSKRDSENNPSSSQQQGAKASGSQGESFFPKEDSLDKFVKKILRRSNSEGDISLSGSSGREEFSSESNSEKETSFVSARGGENQDSKSESGTGNGKAGTSTEQTCNDGASSSSGCTHVHGSSREERENGEVDNPAPVDPPANDDPPAPQAPEVPEHQEMPLVPVENGNDNPVIVQIEEEEEQVANVVNPEPAEPDGHLEWYLHLMNSVGLSWYRREEYAPLPEWRSITLKVVYCIFTFGAMLETFRDIKRRGIGVAHAKDLKGCAKFGFVIVRLFSRSFFVYLVTFCANKISAMLLHMRNIQQYQNRNDQRYSRLAYVLGIGSILSTTITIIFSYSDFGEWSFREALLSRSLFMGKSLFLWTIKNYRNVTTAIIDDYYDTDITITILVMGIAEGALEWCRVMQGEIIRDILLLAPMILWNGWNAFDQRIQPQLLAHPNNTDPAELEACVRQYKAMRQANSSANNALGIIHKFVTIQSLLQYTYLFIQIITMNDVDMSVVGTAIKAIKITVSFAISLRVHGVNENTRKWLSLLTRYNGPVNVEEILGMTIQAALEDLRVDPIGFGTEYFLINEPFLVGFATALVSIIGFLFEAEFGG